MTTRHQKLAAFLIDYYGGLHSLPEEYREAHADYEALRQVGKTIDRMPRKVRERERVYQAVKHLERKRRQGRTQPERTGHDLVTRTLNRLGKRREFDIDHAVFGRLPDENGAKNPAQNERK